MFDTGRRLSDMLRSLLDHRSFSSHPCGCSIQMGGVRFPQGISYLVLFYLTFLLLRRDVSETRVASEDTFPAPRRQEC